MLNKRQIRAGGGEGPKHRKMFKVTSQRQEKRIEVEAKAMADNSHLFGGIRLVFIEKKTFFPFKVHFSPF